MDPTALWNAAIVNPLTEGLRYLYFLFGSYGIAIIAFTIITRLILLPLSLQQIRSSKAMQELQPKLQALQKKYAKDKEALSRETMKLYREHGVNPLSGCLPMLIQLPIWIGLYSALINLSRTQEFAVSFLWIENLAKVPDMTKPLDWILPILTVASQWIVQKMMTPPTQDPQQQAMSSMMMFMPIMFGFFAFQVPAGLVLYWVASNLFSIVQQYFTTGWGSLLPSGRSAGVKTAQPGAKSPLAGLRSLFAAKGPIAQAEEKPTATQPTKTVQRFDQIGVPTSTTTEKQQRKSKLRGDNG